MLSRQTGLRAAIALIVASILGIGAISLSPATADSGMSQLELARVTQANCQVLLAKATTSAARTRARACIADQQVIIDALLSGPSPSPSATQSPSPSPSPTVQPSPTVSPTATTAPPTTPPASPTPGVCPVADTNVPGGQDPWGGCWPGPGNTGVPAGTVLTAYTGPCTITVAGTVIDSKTVTCSTLAIAANDVVIRNSRLVGVDVNNDVAGGGSFTIVDSTVSNGARDQCQCIGTHDYVELRVEVIGGNRSGYCARTCTIRDSWHHGQLLQGAQHGSGQRVEQYATLEHSAVVCDFPVVDDATSLGCSADVTGYGDFSTIRDNTLRRNLFLASITSSFCIYGGSTAGKPHSNDVGAGTNIVIVENVFQRGSNGKCGYYGPVTDFAAGRSGNVWSGNVWDDGGAVSSG